MTKKWFKKMTLSSSTVALSAVPLTLAASCGSSSTDEPKPEPVLTEEQQWDKKATYTMDYINKNPLQFYGVGMTVVKENAFDYETLPHDFQLPDTIREIGASAFYGAKLYKTFKSPRDLQMIRGGAFVDLASPLPETFVIDGKVQWDGGFLGNTVLYEGFKIPYPVNGGGGGSWNDSDPKLPAGCVWFNDKNQIYNSKLDIGDLKPGYSVHKLDWGLAVPR